MPLLLNQHVLCLGIVDYTTVMGVFCKRGRAMWKFRKKEQFWEQILDELVICLLPYWFFFFFCLSLPFSLSDWEEEQVSSPNILRLIYQGRFLHGNVTLGGEKTPSVHLPLIDMHTKSQQCVAGKFCAVLIPFPEPQNRGTSVLRTSLLWWREGGERKYRKRGEREWSGKWQDCR